MLMVVSWGMNVYVPLYAGNTQFIANFSLYDATRNMDLKINLIMQKK